MHRLALSLALLSGCSIALQSKPSREPALAAQSDCSTSRAYAGVDLVGVAAGVTALVAGFFVTSNGNRDSWVSGAGAMTAIAYTASAGNGFRWAARCERGREAPVSATAMNE